MTTTHADHPQNGRHPGTVADDARDARDTRDVRDACDTRDAREPQPAKDQRDRRRRPGRPRSEAAERAILDAVLELLGQGVPYRSLSMEQVAASAGVGKATVYRRWQNKEALVVDAVTTLWTECPTPDLTDGEPTRNLLVEYLENMADLMHSDRAGLVFASVMATAMTNPELVRRYQQVAIEPRRDQMRAILRHGIAAGELRADLDIELTVRMLAGPVVLTMKTEYLREPLPENFVPNLVDSLLQGAAAR
ncbi:TetR/AcrR family transcriptional regulator [Catenulispora subtropica]|uniref:TetR/AcrR family transcriptional regulator n=1 Tax=Catenulispora subtropica TaxID=450798 RepID=A0ABN2QK73_9ACTN